MRLRIFTEPQEGATYDELLAVAQAAERLGFDAFFRSDHYQRLSPGDPGPGSTDAWLTLAALARETSSIRLGTLVTPVTFRYPGPLAIQVAQADAMSGGRVELGLGAGWNGTEHASYAIPFPSQNERFAMLEEQLAILTTMWSAAPGERVTFEGKHYNVVDSPALPKPVQRPRPRIIMGGWGTKRTPRLAARYADEFNMPFAPVSYFREGCDHVRRACEAAGRAPETMRYTVAAVVCVGENARDFERRAIASGQKPDDARANAVAGTPAEAVERIKEFEKAGAETVYLQYHTLGEHEHIELIAAEVMPHVS
jgi:F420-dependent oxidoreductase-like protein